jgi:pre-mRNA-processing factor 6
LEEANGNEEAVRKVIRKAVKTLAKHGVQVEREEWLTEAENCEKSGSKVTCEAIVMETVGLGLEDEDRKATWIEDSENMLGRGSIQTARAILAHATSVFPGKQSLWLRVAQLERKHGDNKSLEDVLQKSVRYCIKSEILWLMLAKHKWQTGDVKGAQEILANAFDALPGSEKIVLAAVKLEKENDGYELARMVLERARSSAPTERIWMKSALLERELQRTDAEKQLLESGLAKFPKYWKFYCMLAQFYERLQNDSEAREIYLNGLKECVDCIPLWIGLSRLEERTNGLSRARAILEKARLRNPQNADLWLEAIRVEARGGEQRIAFNMLAKALQECPKSGTLWAEAIEMESRAAKKARSVDALKRCDQDPHVILAVAKLFWSNRQLDKARTWFNRATSANPDLRGMPGGATLYKFEVQHGTPEQQQEVVNKCVQQEPHHGEKWILESKNPNNHKLKTDQILSLVASRVNVDVSPTVLN